MMLEIAYFSCIVQCYCSFMRFVWMNLYCINTGRNELSHLTLKLLQAHYDGDETQIITSNMIDLKLQLVLIYATSKGQVFQLVSNFCSYRVLIPSSLIGFANVCVISACGKLLRAINSSCSPHAKNTAEKKNYSV